MQRVQLTQGCEEKYSRTKELRNQDSSIIPHTYTQICLFLGSPVTIFFSQKKIELLWFKCKTDLLHTWLPPLKA